jgi:hypothetical protein
MPRPCLVATLLPAFVFWSLAAAFAQTPAAVDGWVALPVDEYRALRDRAIPPVPPSPAPGVEAVLTRVDYELRVDGDSVSGRALLTIDVLRDGWTQVPIPAGLMARDARLDGQPVSLAPGQPPRVILSRAGRAVLTLDIAMPLVTSTGAESIVLPASPAPVSRVALVLSKTGVNLTAGDSFIAEHTETATESRWTVFGRPQQPLALSWKRKVDDRRGDQPLRIRARVSEMVGLGEDGGQVTAAVRVEVLQGLAREIVLAIPSGLVVNQVDGPTVADWDATGETLRVGLLEAVSTEVAFVVQADARAPREGTVSIPLVRVPLAERETGGVAVDVLGAGELGERQARGLDPADASELGDVVAGRELPSMVAFRFRPLAGSDARTLAINVVRYTPQAVLIANVEEARYRALASEDGRQLVEARYAVRNNQRSFLKVTLPAGATLWSADVAGRPIRPGVADMNALLLPLDKGRAGEEAPTFAVSVVYLQRIGEWERSGRTTLELPALDLPISRTGIEFRYSPRYRVEPQPGAFRREDDLGPLAEAFHPPLPPGARAGTGQALGQGAASGLQTLVDRFRNEGGGRTVIGSLPVHVMFPTFGPALFLASELTAESQSPSVDLAFKRVGN